MLNIICEIIVPKAFENVSSINFLTMECFFNFGIFVIIIIDFR